MAQAPSSILALDVGPKRIGVAVASLVARLPRPLVTLQADDADFFTGLQSIIETEGATALVVGYPRGLDGQHTAQTTAIETFTAQLKQRIALPVHFQDEALSSQRAETELETRGKVYTKGDIDALAASFILDDWLKDNPEAE